MLLPVQLSAAVSWTGLRDPKFSPMLPVTGSLLVTPPFLDRIRRDQFSDVISTMRALRLPTHASPVTYLFRFRGPRDSSSVRARRCQRSRADGGPATGQDPCSAGGDAPLSSIGSRRDQFSDVISTMRALRLPTHASPVTYLFRFRGPRDSSSVRA